MKSRFLTVFLSILPGVGHMYLGLMNRGVQVMTLFFCTIFFENMIHLNLFLLLPIVWFFSAFDALEKCNQLNKGTLVSDDPLKPWQDFNMYRGWIGWALIGVGSYLILKEVVSLFNINTYLFEVILGAILFIFIGLRLIWDKNTKTESGGIGQ